MRRDRTGHVDGPHYPIRQASRAPGRSAMHRWSLSFGKTACAGVSPVAGSPNRRDRNPSISRAPGVASSRNLKPPGGHGRCISSGLDPGRRPGGRETRQMLREIPVKRDCFRCGRVEFSAAVSVIVVWAHGLTVGVPMIPKDELRVCGTGNCDAAHRLTSRAFEVHPETQMAVGPWRRALIVLEDGNGVEIRNKGAEKLAVA